MSSKHIIFDFDGTLADSLQALAKVTQVLAPIYHFQAISPELLPELRTMPAQQIINYLGIKPWLVPILMIAVRRRLLAQIPSMRLQPGLGTLFDPLSKHTSSIGILSSNSKKNIAQFLSQHNIRQVNYIHVEKHRLSKRHALKHLMKKNQFHAKDTYYVVDEVRDIEAAKTLGITSIAVTWGYNTKEALQKAEPTFLVETPKALKETLIQPLYF
ncbi:MAG: HAD hydrolase-like protein [Legionellaceae bacterium]|nr:HAD hydrolase-like protein [Legionellaceae bacterium]